MYEPKRPGLVAPAEGVSARVRSTIRAVGVDEAAKVLTLSRETCLLLGAEAHVTRGSLAIAEQRLAELDQSSSGQPATLGEQ